MADININLGLFAVAGGTVDAITATYTPAPPSLYNGLVLFFRASGANTSTTPTFKPNTLAAKTVVKKGNQALVAGDIVGDHGIIFNASIDKWELLNPASDATDSIWEETGGVITAKTLTDILRLGAADPAWGASALEIYSATNDIPFFIGDAGAGQFFWIQDLGLGVGFEILSGGLRLNVAQLNLPNTQVILDVLAGSGTRLLQHDNTGQVSGSNALPSGTTGTTPAAGDNSTKVATTEYVDRVNVQSVASGATVTATAANDLVIITAQAEALTLANPTGSWQQGQALVIRIKDNGTSRTIGYGAKFRALGTTLPTATTISKTIYLFVIYNSTDDTFDVTGVSEQA